MTKMGSQAKEEERIEMILRGLLKLPENRRCINCCSLGPQYVCTTFFTFVCTNCSGVQSHGGVTQCYLCREFTHRVKSISMAKFTAEEVSALQAAGNERARQIYLKGWDPRRNSYPDGSNLHRLRDFIKHVYVDRKYTSDTSEKNDELPRLRLGEREEPYESRKLGAYLGEFTSASYISRYEQSSSRRSYGGRSDDRNFRYYFDERRSPQYNQGNPIFGVRRNSSVHFEIVDDRFRDDVFRSGKRSDSCNFNREYKSGSRSPECQRNTNTSNPSVVCPIKGNFGRNAPLLEIGKHLEAIDGKDADGSSNRNQKTAPSGCQHSVNGNPVEDKKLHLQSLINSNTDPKPTDPPVLAQETQPVTPPGDSGNLSSHESSAKENVWMAPAPNTAEFLLFELAGALVPQSSDYAPSTVSESNTPPGCPLTNSICTTAPTSNVQPTGGNKPETAVSSTAPVDQMLMLHSCVDTSITTSTTNIPVQQSGGSIPPDGASPAISGQMSLPSCFAASTSASTTHLLDEPSGGNMPASSVPPAPLSRQMSTALPNSVSDSTTASTTIVPVSSFDGGPPKVATSRVESAAKVSDVQQLSSLQQHQPLAFFAVDGRRSSSHQTTTPVGPLNYQSWVSSLLPYNQGPSSTSGQQSSQTASNPAQHTSSRVGSEPLSMETKCSGRKELPMDLFTGHLPDHAPIPHWQTGHGQAKGFNMQYYPLVMPVPGYSNPAKSTNPFDLNSETSPVLVPEFPTMEPQQGALPNVGAHSMGFMASQSPSYVSAMGAQSPSLPTAMSSSAFMGQQIYNYMTSTRLQGIDSFGSDRTVLGSSSTQPAGRCLPMATNSYSSEGGNPFE